jgi:hypothetical protein
MTLHEALTILKQYHPQSNSELSKAFGRILKVPEDIKAAYDTWAYDMGIDSEEYYETIKNQE